MGGTRRRWGRRLGRLGLWAATAAALVVAALAVGALVVLALMLRSGKAPDEAAPATTDVDPAVAARTSVSVAAPGEPFAGGALRVAVAALPGSWDPAEERWDAGQVAVVSAVADPLAALGTDGRAHPELARAIDVAPDGRSVDVVLREGVRFHDGTPLDAAAVADHLDRLRRSELWGAALAPVESVGAVDPLRVRIGLTHPWPDLPLALTGQAGLVVHPAAPNDGDAGSAEPIGTGPFRWDRTDEGPERRVVVVRDEDHWRAEPAHLDEIAFVAVPDAGMRDAAVAAGDVDLAVQVAGASVAAAPAAGDQRLVEATPTAGLVVVLTPSSGVNGDGRGRALLAEALVGAVAMPERLGASEGAGPFDDPALDADPIDTADLAERIATWEAANGPLRLDLAVRPDADEHAGALDVADTVTALDVEVAVHSVENPSLGERAVVLPTLAPAPEVGDPLLLRALAEVDPEALDLLAATRAAPAAERPARLAALAAHLRTGTTAVALWRAPVVLPADGDVQGLVGATTADGVERVAVHAGVVPWADAWLARR